ncbi:MAG: glycosyltransferase family 9 protein [Bryobacteraceae bacterium]
MRTLLIRPGAVGDFILSLPALECLRSDSTEVWCAASNVPLARFADHAASLSSTGLDWLELPGIEPPQPLVGRLRTFDRIVSWYGSNRAQFREAAKRLDLPITFFSALPSVSGQHAVDFYLSQARQLVPHGGECIPRLSVPPAPRESRVVIHPFASNAAKRWPLERFLRVGEELSSDGWEVCYTAGPEESMDLAVRFENLWELACWLSTATLYIGNDSGIAHLAAAAGTPVLVLFGPTDPAIWAPRGDVVRVVTQMLTVTADDVAETARAMIGSNHHSRE